MNLEVVIEEIINWKKGNENTIFTNELLSLAGSPLGDWFPFGASRANHQDNYNRLESFVGKETYLANLQVAYNEAVLIQEEIESIVNDIKTHLYPFEQLGIKDCKQIADILKRINALSEYDQTKIDSLSLQDIVKSKTQIDNKILALKISGGCFMIMALAGIILIYNIKARKKAKMLPESDE